MYILSVGLWTGDRHWASKINKSAGIQWHWQLSLMDYSDFTCSNHRQSLARSTVCTRISAHLLRTLSDSSRSSPSGSPPRWWWCSRCPSLSGGRERHRTECVSAPPGWFSACRTVGRQRREKVFVCSFAILLAFSWCHVTALNICQYVVYVK